MYLSLQVAPLDDDNEELLLLASLHYSVQTLDYGWPLLLEAGRLPALAEAFSQRYASANEFFP